MDKTQSAMDAFGLIRSALSGDLAGTDAVVESLEPDELKRMVYSLLAFSVLATATMAMQSGHDPDAFIDGMLAAGRAL